MADLARLYESHLAEKEVAFRSLLAPLGYEPVFGGSVPSPLYEGHRSRVKCVLEWQDSRTTPRLAGFDPFRGRGGFEETSWLFPPFGQTVAWGIFEVLASAPDGLPVDGFELQLTHGAEEAHVSLAVKRCAVGCGAPVAEILLEKVPGLRGVAIPSQGVEAGESFLLHRIGETRFYSHHRAFFQVNHRLTPLLVGAVKEMAGEDVGSIVDLYCGMGLHALSLSGGDARIDGVDASEKAVESAERNRRARGLERGRYRCSTVERFTAVHRPDVPDLVILNPPRGGCPEAVIDAVAAWRPRKILAVSCFPETHGRDLAVWRMRGYRAREIRAFDMFPFTRFLETVTLLEPA